MPVLDRTSNYLGESNWAGDARLNGGIADVRVWNTARSQAEIQANMPVGSITGPTNGLVAAYAFGATGDAPTADLSGNGYTATQNGALDYSKSGTGTLTTGGFSNAGATVNLDVTEGQLNITGTNSVDRLQVYDGAVSQAAGSAVTTTGPAIPPPFQIGVSAGQNGSYAISGGSLNITNDGLAFIGASGNGTMTQTGGEVTTDGWTVIGRFVGGVGDYTISGGSLSHSSAGTKILVGEEGTGTLTISGTGEVSTTGGVSIAHQVGGVGTVNLDGGTLTTPGIVKGSGTSATLNMDGGTIVASGNNADFMSGLDVAELKAGGGTINDGGFQIVVGQAFSGAGGLTKTGSGTVTLTGASTYTGATTVTGGLIVNGSIAGSTTTVQNGGFLGGSGTVGSLIVQNGGTVSPGNSPGTLNITGDIDWLGGGSYNWQVLSTAGTPGTDWDLLTVTGTLDLTALSCGQQVQHQPLVARLDRSGYRRQHRRLRSHHRLRMAGRGREQHHRLRRLVFRGQLRGDQRHGGIQQPARSRLHLRCAAGRRQPLRRLRSRPRTLDLRAAGLGACCLGCARAASSLLSLRFLRRSPERTAATRPYRSDLGRGPSLGIGEPRESCGWRVAGLSFSP